MPNNKLAILYLTLETYPTFRVDVNELFANEFERLGHRITWVFRAEAPLAATKVFRWQRHLALLTPSSFFKRSLLRKMHNFVLDRVREYHLCRLALRHKYDFIQVRDDIFAATVGLLLSKWVNTPFVYWMSFPIPETGMERALRKPKWYGWILYLRWYIAYQIMHKLILRQASFVFAQSDQMKLDLIATGIPADKIMAVPMGVQLRKFTLEPLRPQQANEHFTIAYLGTLDAERHLEILVDVLAQVIPQIPNARLLLIGDAEDPADKQLLLQRAQALNLGDRIHITGMLKQSAAWQQVVDADVCVSPIYPSPFFLCASPTKLLEYMALQKPVVANDIPEQKDVLSKSQAGICVNWQVEEFAAAIVYCYQNPAISQTMGQKGLQYIKEFRSYDILARKLAEQYLLLKNNKAPICGEADALVCHEAE